MPMFMDVHDIPGVKAGDVVGAHEADLRVQGQYGVNYEHYWRWLPRPLRHGLEQGGARLDQRKPRFRQLAKLFEGAAMEGDDRLIHYFVWAKESQLLNLYTPAFRPIDCLFHYLHLHRRLPERGCGRRAVPKPRVRRFHVKAIFSRMPPIDIETESIKYANTYNDDRVSRSGGRQ